MSSAEGNNCVRITADLKSWFGKSLRFVVPIGCSAALLLWLFHKVNFSDMMRVIHQGVNYWWILVMLVFNFFSYVIRGFRWGMQLSGVGVNAKKGELVVSIFGAYALNLLFTGFGETWRCLFISHREKASLSKVIGTDLGDRLSDAAMVIVVLFLALIFANSSIHDFIVKYGISRDTKHIVDDPRIWIIVASALFIIWGLNHMLKHCSIVEKIDNVVDQIWEGLKVIFTMKHKGKYLLLTAGIWTCYFMQTYVCFNAFPFTAPLMGHEYCYGLLPGLVALLFGSLSMAIPSSGGLGPWNLAIMFALSLYGINATEGAAFAMLAWSAEALLQVSLGIFSLIYVTRTSR